MSRCDKMIQDIKIGDKIGKNLEVKWIFGGNHQQNIEDESGIGVVYLVRNINNDEPYALKTFQDQYIKEIDTLNEFKFESLEWIKLTPHPNVVSAITAEIIEDRPFLFLEPIVPINNKQTLKHYLYDPLDLKQILDWSIQFCHGMEFINDSGIKVHGDIKPSNILIFFNQVKISDFGLLELFESNNDHILEKYYSTKQGQGTMEYMAPEAFNGKRSIESDIYSFGVVLYQLVNKGITPFENDGFQDWQEIHKNTIIPQMDSVLNDLIHKCLENEPENRYHSFKDLRQDLETIYNERFDNLYNPKLIEIDEYLHHALLGHSYCVYEELDLFKKSYEIALKSDETYIHEMYAEDLMYLKEFEKAKNRFKIVISKLSESNDEYIKKEGIFFNLGNAYSSLNQIFDAMECYNKTIQENENHAKAKVNLGNCYRVLGDFEKSIGYYDKVLDDFPDFPEALYNKALSLCELNQPEEAEKLFERIDENFDDGQRFIDKSLIFSKTDKKKSFLELVNYLGKHEDNYSRYLLLDLHLSMGKFDSAKTTYENFLSVVENKNDVRILASSMFYDYGYKDYSSEILENIRTSGEKKCKYESYLLKAYYINDTDINHMVRLLNHVIKKSESKRQKAEAYNIKFTYEDRNIRYLDKSLKLNPNFEDSHLNYIKYYIDTGKYDKALTRIQLAKKKFKNNPEIYFLEGQLHFNKNEFEKAKELFKLSLKYGKIEPPVYLYIRDCYIKLENEDKAIEYEDYAVTLDKNYAFVEFYYYIS